MISQDKGDSAPNTSQLQAVSQAHKTYYITEEKRTAKYGCKNTGQDLDFLSTSSGVEQTTEARKYIKVFQHLPMTTGGPVHIQHSCQLFITLGLKDSRALSGN